MSRTNERPVFLRLAGPLVASRLSTIQVEPSQSGLAAALAMIEALPPQYWLWWSK